MLLRPKKMLLCKGTFNTVLPFSFNEVLVPDSALVCLLSLCVYSPLGDKFYVFFFFLCLMTSKFLSPDFFPRDFILIHNYSLTISPWMSDIHLKLNMSKFRFPFFVLSKLACLVAFCVLLSGNSVLPAALDKTLRPSSAPCALYLPHQQILLVLTLRYIEK